MVSDREQGPLIPSRTPVSRSQFVGASPLQFDRCVALSGAFHASVMTVSRFLGPLCPRGALCVKPGTSSCAWALFVSPSFAVAALSVGLYFPSVLCCRAAPLSTGLSFLTTVA